MGIVIAAGLEVAGLVLMAILWIASPMQYAGTNLMISLALGLLVLGLGIYIYFCCSRQMVGFDDVDQAVTSVEQQHAQVFLLEQAHLVLHQGSRLGRGMDGRAIRRRLLQGFARQR